MSILCLLHMCFILMCSADLKCVIKVVKFTCRFAQASPLADIISMHAPNPHFLHSGWQSLLPAHFYSSLYQWTLSFPFALPSAQTLPPPLCCLCAILRLCAQIGRHIIQCPLHPHPQSTWEYIPHHTKWHQVWISMTLFTCTCPCSYILSSIYCILCPCRTHT